MSIPLNQLLPKEIEHLDADELVRLLHRLLHCEARHRQLRTPEILVPFQINVPDGGRDGKWHTDIGSHEYIPRALTYYQCKAEHITAADCEKEVAPEKKNEDGKITYVVKDRVREVLSQGGCYAFFSSKHEIKPKEHDELEHIVRKRLRLANFTPHADAKIEFLGCNRIADWTNRFPSAVRFVREITKDQGGIHYHTMESWQKQLMPQGRYFSNEVLSGKISAIRAALSEGKTRVIRLTGLSGLGKTRLAFEALKNVPNDAVTANALGAATIYLSYDDVRDGLMNFINHLVSGDYSAIIVIDDCPGNVHDRIVDVIKPSALSVVTIFHEPQEQRQDTLPLTIEPEALGDVVEKILRESPHLLAQGEDAIKAVAAFAEGFPQIARLLVEFRRAPSMQELSDRAGLFRKLLSGRAPPDDPTLNTVQSLAIFRTIGGSRQKLDADLEVIRTTFCPHVSAVNFRRVIEEQKRRRIVQQTADTLTVAPRPLAVALTAGFLPICPGNWKDHLAVLTNAELVTAFARRIEELELSDKADELGRLFAEEKIPFDDAEYLITGTTASQVFRALTVLNPSSACKVAQKTIGRLSLERLGQATHARRSLVRALEIMVWGQTTFSPAAPLLLKLAAAENEAWSNNATGEFGQLFRLFLSGTTVPASERLPVIRDALDSDEPRIRRVAVRALGAALQDGGYTRMSDTTLAGKRDANKDWRPTTHDEIFAYWKECYLILQRLITANSPESELAKDILGQNMHGILNSRLLLDLELDFKRLANHVNGLWPDMKASIRLLLEHRENLTAEHRAALERWRDYLTPPAAATDERLRDVVTKPGRHHRKGADGHYIDLSQLEAESLAGEIARTGFDLRPHLAMLLIGEQQQAIAFGTALARHHPMARAFMEEALQAWPNLKSEARNESLVRGLMFGLPDRSYQTAILERVATDLRLIDLLIPLTGALSPVTETDFLRIRAAVERGQIPVELLRNLIPGLPLRALPDAFLKIQLEDIAHARKETVPTLFEVLFLHCHGETAKFDYFRDTFRQFALTPGLPILDTHLGWEWHEVVQSLIASSADEKWLGDLAHYIVSVLRENETFIGTDYLRKVAIQLLRKAPAVAWPAFADALAASEGMLRFTAAEFLGSGSHGFDDHGEDLPIWQIPQPQFEAWINEHLDLVPLLLDRMQLYTVTKDEAGIEHFHWHPYALLLLARAPDEAEALNEVFGNLFSFGSTGSRIPYWQRRRALASALADSPSPRLRRIGGVLTERIDEAIEHTRREELNEQARHR